MSTPHEAKVLALQLQLTQSFKEGKTVCFKRKSTNSTRARVAVGSSIELDLTTLNDILGVNAEQRFIDVEPGVPMDALITETLKHALIPPVVPEFPGITAGGAVQGGALESSSFRHGQFNDTVLEYDLLLADGTKITATPDNDHADIFYGISTSHGSLAIVTRIRVGLIPAKTYVSLIISPHGSAEDCIAAIKSCTAIDEIEFIEGLIFSETSAAVIAGRMTDVADQPVQRFGRNIDPWYHRFMAKAAQGGQSTITVPLVDYLFRYDKGAFWMGEHLFPLFGVRSSPLTRFFLAPISRTRKLYDGLHAMNIQHEFIIQDFYMNWDEAIAIIDFNRRGPQLSPVWLCPIKSAATPQNLSCHYRDTDQMLLNVGLYGKPVAGDAVALTIELGKLIANSPNRKMLYAQTFETESEFWNKYDFNWYASLRQKYKATAFRDVWSKVHTPNSAFKSRKVRGFIQVAVEALWGKNVVWK